MAMFSVDAQSLAAASSSVRTTASSISSQVQAMLGQLTNLQNSWQGSAANAFVGVTEQWRAAQQNVEQALQSITMALDNASAIYSDSEAQAMRMFAG